jgi:hypothetical protein
MSAEQKRQDGDRLPMSQHETARLRQLHRSCQDIIEQIMGQESSFFFFRPVHPDEDGAPDYLRFIARPMSILDVQANLDDGKYGSFEPFIVDMRQIWQNALIYNKPQHAIYRAVAKLSQHFELLAAALPHRADQDGRLQRLIELRFANYRMQKRSHQ